MNHARTAGFIRRHQRTLAVKVFLFGVGLRRSQPDPSAVPKAARRLSTSFSCSCKTKAVRAVMVVEQGIAHRAKRARAPSLPRRSGRVHRVTKEKDRQQAGRWFGRLYIYLKGSSNCLMGFGGPDVSRGGISLRGGKGRAGYARVDIAAPCFLRDDLRRRSVALQRGAFTLIGTFARDPKKPDAILRLYVGGRAGAADLRSATTWSLRTRRWPGGRMWASVTGQGYARLNRSPR